MTVDIQSVITYVITIAPFAIGCVVYFVKMESKISVIKNDIEWIKEKTLERRKYDKPCPHCDGD